MKEKYRSWTISYGLVLIWLFNLNFCTFSISGAFLTKSFSHVIIEKISNSSELGIVQKKCFNHATCLFKIGHFTRIIRVFLPACRVFSVSTLLTNQGTSFFEARKYSFPVRKWSKRTENGPITIF